jgi:transcriptional regulator with XRE-family HTH domain
VAKLTSYFAETATKMCETGLMDAPANPNPNPNAHSQAKSEPAADSTDAVLSAVGPRLKALRQRRQTTLTDVSEQTGISVSTLSRLESGQRRPNLELLLPLARAYGVPLDELVGAPATGDPRIHLRPLARHGHTIIPLSANSSGLQAFKHIIPASKPLSEPTPKVHPGHDWIYVLRGELRLVLGEHDLILPAGEAAEFSTLTPHWFGRAGEGDVEFLSLFGRQGERMHVRASPASD